MNTNPQQNQEFIAVSQSIISLETEQINQAITFSHKGHNEDEQWQIYLQFLALCVIQNWLESREPKLSIKPEKVNWFQSKYPNLINAICHLKIGDFQVCIIPTELTYNQVKIPRVVLDLPEFTAQIYLLVEIQDEEATGIIKGFLRYDQWLTYCQEKPSIQGEYYQLPVTYFDSNLEQLLLYLRCLEPVAIPTPETTVQSQNLLSEISENFDSLKQYLRDSLVLVNESSINIWDLLQNKLDEVAQNIFGTPELIPSVLRKNEVSLSGIIAAIERDFEIEIPQQVKPLSHNFELAGIDFNLYLLLWELPETSEFMLLAILGNVKSENESAIGTKLRVSGSGIWVEETLKSERNYTIIQIEAEENDQFLISVEFNGEIYSLPPLDSLKN